MAQIVWTERAWKVYRSCLKYSHDEFGAKAAKRFFENVSKRTRRLEHYPLTGFIEPMLSDSKHTNSFKASSYTCMTR
jgi:plasmid stabilization system protein ParE